MKYLGDWRQLVPAILAGSVIGVVSVILSLSFAALIFAGPLADKLSEGIGLILFTGAVAGISVAVFSSFPGSIAIPQDKIAPILALMVSLIVADIGDKIPPENLLPTAIGALMLATILTGTFLFLMGVFRLGELIRFIPFPVIGGFLGGTGWLLVKGSFRVMAGKPLELDTLGFLLSSDALVRWFPGVVIAGVLLFAIPRWKHVLTMPAVLIGAFLLYHLALLALGVNLAEAESAGFLLGRLPSEATWRPLTLDAFANAEWMYVFEQSGAVVTIVLVSAVGVLLNSSALEIAARQDIDLNRELRAAGMTNLISGFGGGIIGFHTLSVSTLVIKMGVKSRLVGITAGLVCILMIFIGTAPLALFPKAMLGGLLMYLGITFLLEWLVHAYHRMSLSDYAIVLMIIGIVGTFGFLQGAGAGIIACVALFVVNYSRISVAKHELTGRDLASNVDRSPEESQYLRAEGEKTLIFALQGFMFFGTATKLQHQVVERCEAGGSATIRFVAFDFSHVSGMDSSAAMSFSKLLQFAEKRHLTLVFAGLPADIRRLLVQAGFDKEFDPGYRIIGDLDRALEWCENELLREQAENNEGGSLAAPSFIARLEADFGGGNLAGRFLAHLVPVEIPSGGILMHQNDPPDDMYFLEAGTLSVMLIGKEGQQVRLRSMRPGAMVGEMGFYLGEKRSASVLAAEDCRLMKLSRSSFESLEKSDPEATSAFHRMMIQRLAERLRNTDLMIKVLMV
jgi:SulP family sulfate permease